MHLLDTEIMVVMGRVWNSWSIVVLERIYSFFVEVCS